MDETLVQFTLRSETCEDGIQGASAGESGMRGRNVRPSVDKQLEHFCLDKRQRVAWRSNFSMVIMQVYADKPSKLLHSRKSLRQM